MTKVARAQSAPSRGPHGARLRRGVEADTANQAKALTGMSPLDSARGVLSDSRRTRVRPWLVAGALASFTLSLAAAQAPKTIWDGVYTDAQAGRGKKAYITKCAACHNEGLQGGDLAPALKGEEFFLRWNDKSMFEFVDRTQKTMPQDDPGSLSAQENADIVAYILQVNRVSTGAADLPSDAAALKAITITTK
ncbi:MAG: c-type cytochrome [Vicinamibacterales bacterium]